MNKQKIVLNEYNLLMENSVYLPAVSGILHAYADTFPELKQNYEFDPYIFFRDKTENILKKYDNPSVAGFSASMWNIELSLAVAKEVKARYPNCLIVFGGASTPFKAEKFFEDNPFIDVTVRGEGEQTFVEILKRNLTSRNFADIPGISWRDENGKCVRNTASPERRKDLDIYPCAYAGGYFDKLLETETINFQAIIETNRGCPYNCSFCYWGQNGAAKKYNLFGIERIKRTLDWCAAKQIKYLFCADANFGIFERDYEIAQYLVDLKKNTNSPEKFRVCYAKNQGDTVFKIGKLLADNKLEKGVTMALQSNDQQVLVNVGRKNIKLDTFKTIQKKCNEADIPTYTEMIFGMPGETYKSFVDGIETTLESSVFCQLFVYLCLVLTNTEMAQPEYIDAHGIGISVVPISEIHTVPREDGIVTEYEHLITSTSSLSQDDWRRGAVMMWVVQLFHGLKLCFFAQAYLKYELGIKYTDLFEYIISKNDDKYPFIKNEIQNLYAIADGILNGKERGQILSEFSKIYWEPEEAIYLRIAKNKTVFFNELAGIIKELLAEKRILHNEELIKEVLTYQQARVPSLSEDSPDTYEFKYNIPEYFYKLFLDNKISITNKPQMMNLTNRKNYANDKAQFARETILYGRKSNGMMLAVKWENK